MANLRKRKKFAAPSKKNWKENLRNNIARIKSATNSQKDYITQVSEEIEDRITKMLSKEFSRKMNRILAALSQLDEFHFYLLIQGHSGSAMEISKNTFYTNQGTNDDDSQLDPHPEARVSQSQTAQAFGSDDSYDSQVRNLFQNISFRFPFMLKLSIKAVFS